MSVEYMIASHIDSAIQHAAVWGFVLILFFMTVESLFFSPIPSEIVMIPAGFLAYRGELTTGIPWLDLVLAILCGLTGAMLGAYFNYYAAAWLGRPFLHKYGKYFFLPEASLNRAEEVFRKYGELTTFVCRLLPAIRQIIPLPAGLARMDLRSFSLFTALGAGIWTAILAVAGWYLGHLAGNMTPLEMALKGKDMIIRHYIWIFVFLAVFVAAYLAVQKWIMRPEMEK
ncbi:MAG: Inner membrane protein YqjA [Lentisphaerae bacterium ADurb.Bin242]|nr:MAG: Inner membrane protein YqjA [Lentisphaerae bacterium ADurb.Bin242]